TRSTALSNSAGARLLRIRRTLISTVTWPMRGIASSRSSAGSVRSSTRRVDAQMQVNSRPFVIRRMRRTVAYALLAFGTITGRAAAQTPQETSPRSDQTVPVTRGSRLSINNMAGEVVIRTWDKDALRVQARHSPRVKVNIRQSEAGVTVRAASDGPAASV